MPGEAPLVRRLGRVGYEEALAMQDALAAGVAAGGREMCLLLEHEPVYTIGRGRDRSSLGDRAGLAHPVFEVNRGGQATYHGPGQLVGYPLLDLARRGRDLHRYMRFLETWLLDACAHWGIAAERRRGLTGVWVGRRKLASLGVGLRRWVTMHGFALNVSNDLAPFRAITPCGIEGVEMTSLSAELGHPVSTAQATGVVAELLPRALEAELPSG